MFRGLYQFTRARGGGGGGNGLYQFISPHLVLRSRSPARTEPIRSATLTFTPSNWNKVQTVTLTAIDDAMSENRCMHGCVGVQENGGLKSKL
jgi:hypothetical protein